MNSRRKFFFISFLKYSISLAIAISLFWYVYRDVNFGQLFSRFTQINVYLLLLSLFIGIVSYWIRAFRWKLLFEPIGYNVKTARTFVALMVGYFANAIVPRMGEITRCLILKKTNKVDVTSSIGTVVAERAIDMLTLALIMFAGFIIEFDKLKELLISNLNVNTNLIERNLWVILIAIPVIVIVFLVAGIIFRKNHDRFRHHPVFVKLRTIVREILDGFFAIRRVKHPYLFWLSTILIWVLYFLMSYILFFAFPPTTGLGISAGILVLIMGGLGMATPVQAGIGAFHLFVISALLLYNIPEDDGKFFAFVLHTSQTLMAVVIGGISFLVSLSLSKKEIKNGH